MTDSDISIANDRTTIIEAARIAGMDIPDYGITSSKLYCPFGDLYHPDNAKSFRVYPNENTAFCFAGCGWFNPVKLVGMSKGLSDADSAEFLLEQSGYVPPDIESRWKAATEVAEVVDTDYLAEALKTACTRMDPDWEFRQFEERIAITFRKCLELLPRVTTGKEATEWLTTTKKIMHQVLGATP